MSFFRDPYKVAFSLACLFVLSAVVYRIFFIAGEDVPAPRRVVPELGEAGSDHRHASVAVVIGDRLVSFCEPKFMVKSNLVHFEDDNCNVVHKHARGVTLATFFKTLGVEVVGKCITIPDEEKRCDDGVYQLRVSWNGAEVPVSDLPFLELNDNDRILINFGLEEGPELRLKWNQVPSVPEFIRKTSVGNATPSETTSP
jgi:hypothetical protein